MEDPFPKTRFLMFTDHPDALAYALSVPRSLPTGVRIDCLGASDLGGVGKQLLDADPSVGRRWRVAPL
jgi:hypothetical protein